MCHIAYWSSSGWPGKSNISVEEVQGRAGRPTFGWRDWYSLVGKWKLENATLGVTERGLGMW